MLGCGITGPLFGFSDTWQLVINTGTTIVLFLIQNTQNRDSRALHLKLDELLRAIQGARETFFIDLEQRDEQQQKAAKEALLPACSVCLSEEEHARHPDHPHVQQPRSQQPLQVPELPREKGRHSCEQRP